MKIGRKGLKIVQRAQNRTTQKILFFYNTLIINNLKIIFFKKKYQLLFLIDQGQNTKYSPCFGCG